MKNEETKGYRHVEFRRRTPLRPIEFSAMFGVEGAEVAKGYGFPLKNHEAEKLLTDLCGLLGEHVVSRALAEVSHPNAPEACHCGDNDGLKCSLDGCPYQSRLEKSVDFLTRYLDSQPSEYSLKISEKVKRLAEVHRKRAEVAATFGDADDGYDFHALWAATCQKASTALDDPNILLIVLAGPPQSGKTEMIHALARKAAAKGTAHVVCPTTGIAERSARRFGQDVTPQNLKFCGASGLTKKRRSPLKFIFFDGVEALPGWGGMVDPTPIMMYAIKETEKQAGGKVIASGDVSGLSLGHAHGLDSSEFMVIQLPPPMIGGMFSPGSDEPEEN